MALLLLVVLAARPALIDSGEESRNRNEVVLLLDRSESMSLACGKQSRFDEALEMARQNLLPALKASDIRVRALLFAEDATAADGRQIAAAKPDGKRTNLARAIVRAIVQSDRPPLAVIALTDGANTEDADNARATHRPDQVSRSLDRHRMWPGDGRQVLSLEDVSAPPVAAPHQEFRVAARLRATGDNALPRFDLLLLRDGQFAQKKSVSAGSGAGLAGELCGDGAGGTALPLYGAVDAPRRAEPEVPFHDGHGGRTDRRGEGVPRVVCPGGFDLGL